MPDTPELEAEPEDRAGLVTLTMLSRSGGGGFGRSPARGPRLPPSPDKGWLKGEELRKRAREHPEEFPETPPEELAAWVTRITAKMTGGKA